MTVDEKSINRRTLLAQLLGIALVGAIPDDADARGRRGGTTRRRSRSRRSRGGSPSYVSSAGSNSSFGSCAQARAAGAAPLRRGRPGYSTRLDRDGDGVACE